MAYFRCGLCKSRKTSVAWNLVKIQTCYFLDTITYKVTAAPNCSASFLWSFVRKVYIWWEFIEIVKIEFEILSIRVCVSLVVGYPSMDGLTTLCHMHKLFSVT